MAQQGLMGLLEEPKMTAALIGTARDIEKRIDINLKRLRVGEYNPKRKAGKPSGKHGRIPGTMRRSIYWAIYNATGGDEYKIKFWMEAVANYVELAVQGAGNATVGADGRLKASTSGGWRVRNGGLPKAINRKNYSGIEVNRVNSRGATLKRKAKPFIGGELRVHGRMLFERLVRDYAYVGNVLMASAIDVRSILPYIDPNTGKNTAKKIHSDNPRTMEEMLQEMSQNRNNDHAALQHHGWNPVEKSRGDWDELKK